MNANIWKICDYIFGGCFVVVEVVWCYYDLYYKWYYNEAFRYTEGPDHIWKPFSNIAEYSRNPQFASPYYYYYYDSVDQQNKGVSVLSTEYSDDNLDKKNEHIQKAHGEKNRPFHFSVSIRILLYYYVTERNFGKLYFIRHN